jgi:transketolase
MGEGGSEGKSGFIGMTGFGASAPAPTLYKEFGITPERRHPSLRAKAVF